MIEKPNVFVFTVNHSAPADLSPFFGIPDPCIDSEVASMVGRHKSQFDKWQDAGIEQGRKDAAELYGAITKHGADVAHNAQSDRMVNRLDKMRGAGIADRQIRIWSDAHGAAFTATLEEYSRHAGPQQKTASMLAGSGRCNH